ncbi:AAA family ATPase [Motilimonas cestriensis]|uniref:AAA family ATPase n=1 Tax=Motilimonas cestriensis TaxID=2742685 RepID=UPI003DA64843
MTQLTLSQFPFCAVQGQSEFKLALILAAINPAIGGVLVAGPRGCAKSTLARALVGVLPAPQQQVIPFVNLPLGASEEMLIGSLDLQQVINKREVVLKPGLLHKANGGILYCDEVNLLPDSLVDQLLDVAASGVNHIERDGISQSHAARFTLIGTMNPEEGELRPQLQDRFGLMVSLDNQFTLEQRIAIVAAREAFEADPDSFIVQYQSQQQTLKQQIQSAQQILADVRCDQKARICIAQRCMDAQVDGMRADIVMHRAAGAHAAWQGRVTVNETDIAVVAPLVLAHRRHDNNDANGSENSSTNGSSNGEGEVPAEQNSAPQSTFKRPDSTKESSSASKDPLSSPQGKAPPGESKARAGDWGQMSEAQVALPPLAHNVISASQLKQITTKVNAQSARASVQQARLEQSAKHSYGVMRHRDGRNKQNGSAGAINWFTTLGQHFKFSAKTWPPQRLFRRPQSQGASQLHLLLLDSSASTISAKVSALAKAACVDIAHAAYCSRAQLALFSFGNQQIKQWLKAGRAPKSVLGTLNQIQLAGGTPLREALAHAQQYIARQARTQPLLQVICYVISDGRSRAQLDDIRLGATTYWLDTEKGANPGQIKRGRGPVLAQQLGAHYLALQA